MQPIHPTAIIDAAAQLGSGVTIGAYSVVGQQVTLGDGVKLHSHVVIDGFTTVGAGCEVYPFAVLGASPQHTRYDGEPSELHIGSNCVIREHVTMHPGTAIGAMQTIVGKNGLFFAGALALPLADVLANVELAKAQAAKGVSINQTTVNSRSVSTYFAKPDKKDAPVFF